MDVNRSIEKKVEGNTPVTWYPSKLQPRLLSSEVVDMNPKIVDTYASLCGFKSQL